MGKEGVHVGVPILSYFKFPPTTSSVRLQTFRYHLRAWWAMLADAKDLDPTGKLCLKVPRRGSDPKRNDLIYFVSGIARGLANVGSGYFGIVASL